MEELEQKASELLAKVENLLNSDENAVNHQGRYYNLYKKLISLSIKPQCVVDAFNTDKEDFRSFGSCGSSFTKDEEKHKSLEKKRNKNSTEPNGLTRLSNFNSKSTSKYSNQSSSSSTKQSTENKEKKKKIKRQSIMSSKIDEIEILLAAIDKEMKEQK